MCSSLIFELLGLRGLGQFPRSLFCLEKDINRVKKDSGKVKYGSLIYYIYIIIKN